MTRKSLKEKQKISPIRHLVCAIVKGNTSKAAAATQECLQAGLSPSSIVEHGIMKGLNKVGEKWKTYEYFIPNVLVSALATKLCLETLHPALKDSKSIAIGKIVAGTVKGDVHDIGKNIVLMFMEASGFDVVDMGIDVAPEQFVKAVKKEKPDLLLLSCLYTVTMHAVEDTIIALNKAGLRGKIKTLIGGAPITREFAESIGADGFGIDAVDGVKVATELLKQETHAERLRS